MKFFVLFSVQEVCEQAEGQKHCVQKETTRGMKADCFGMR